jgi:hypothetical protein
MTVCDTLRDSEIDRYTGTATRILNSADVFPVWLHNYALLSVLGQSSNLLEGWVALSPPLW